jgi:hypothetical protein
MKRNISFLLLLMHTTLALAQVKPEYLYNTRMPYGTLDIRTRISSTEYYYLQEGKTFSFRERSPGVKTNTFLNMTSWDTSPYREGNLRKKSGTQDEFIMNYRLLPPLNYSASYRNGYPLMVIFHGAIERGNCYYNNCYHSNRQYNPNVNQPPAPTASDHKLLNNDDHLNIGAKEHLDARNLAGHRLPNDAAMPAKAFPGFVVMPQMLNVWDSLNVEDVIRLVQLHVEKYNIDPDRIYVQGYSIGGYGVYEAMKRAPWLFAASVPMSAISEGANIFQHNQQDKVSHIPLWIFQGALDKRPDPQTTEALISRFKKAGAYVRYTKYQNIAHRVWERAYTEPDFFSWLLQQRKSNIHIQAGNTVVDKAKKQFPVLVMAEGYLAYQWEKDGKIIPTAKANTLTVTSAGVYRARFSRVSTSPAESQWNTWSVVVKITGDKSNDDSPPGDDDTSEDEDDSTGDDDDNTGGDSDNDDSADDDSGGDSGDNDDGNTDGEDNDDSAGGDDSSDDDDSGEDDEDNDGDAGDNDNDSDDGGSSGDDDNSGGSDEDDSEDDDSADGDDSTGDENGPDDQDEDLGNDEDGDEPDELVTGLDESKEMSFTVYPNPAQPGNLYVSIINAQVNTINIIVYDLPGNVLYQTRYSGYSPGEATLHLPLLLKEGAYLLAADDGKTVVYRRFIITR